MVGATRSVPIKTRYGASPVSLAPVGALPTGWTITGTTVKYTPTRGVGTVSVLRYTYADTEGMTSQEGKVTMTVIPVAQASDVTADVPGSSDGLLPEHADADEQLVLLQGPGHGCHLASGRDPAGATSSSTPPPWPRATSR